MVKGKQGGLTRERDLLRQLARVPPSGGRLSDLAELSGLGKSTTHRLLGGLRDAGLVEQDSVTRRYHLGFELFTLGQAASARFSVLELARSALQRLVDHTEDTGYLAAPSGTESVCVARLEGTFPIKTLTLRVGDRRPLGVGSGALVQLAFRPDSEIESILEANAQRYREYPYFDVASAFQLIEATRRQGFAFSDNIIVPGMRAVAVPIFDKAGRPVAAMTISAISDRLKAERRANVVAAMQKEARRIEERLWRGQSDRSREIDTSPPADLGESRA